MPDIVGLVGGYIFSDNSADRGDYSDKSDNTNDAYVVVVNKSSVVGWCQGDKIIILGCESVFGNLVDLLVERGQVDVLADLIIDSVFNDSVGVQGFSFLYHLVAYTIDYSVVSSG